MESMISLISIMGEVECGLEFFDKFLQRLFIRHARKHSCSISCPSCPSISLILCFYQIINCNKLRYSRSNKLNKNNGKKEEESNKDE